MKKVLFVCLGNICRSPTAEGIFRKKVDDLGLSHLIQIDSAGTADWHTGKAPDSRSIAFAKRRGYDLSRLRARQVKVDDFHEFDYILAMDNENLANLNAIKPKDFNGKLGLFLEYGKDVDVSEVPDPYYGGDEGFDYVVDLIEAASAGLLEELTS
ncbi:MAG: low molecular weight protein-tyrosine-phosphatase [Cellvibrio sp.]